MKKKLLAALLATAMTVTMFSFFPNLLTSGFKLWLDQRNDLSVLFQVIADWEKYLRQRNKRNIN